MTGFLPATTPGATRHYQPSDWYTVLVADPDEAAVGEVASVCRSSDVSVVGCADGAQALFHVGRTCPDLIILRAHLTTVSTAAVVSIVRSSDDVPIVLGVGQGETDLLGPALLAGASEVMERPYRKREIAALIARRLPDVQARKLEAAHIDFGPLRLDGPAMTVRLNERLLPVTMREFELLRLLVVNADRVVSYDEIRRQVWEVRGESVTPRTIAVHATRLRKQLAGVIDVVGVRGLGYRLERLPR